MAEHNNHQRPANRHLEVPALSGGSLRETPKNPSTLYKSLCAKSYLHFKQHSFQFFPKTSVSTRARETVCMENRSQPGTWALSSNTGAWRARGYQHTEGAQRKRQLKENDISKRNRREGACWQHNGRDGWWALGSHSSTESGFTRTLRPWQTDTLTPISEHHIFRPYFWNWVFLIVQTFSPPLA